jgi:hypothetical protein
MTVIPHNQYFVWGKGALMQGLRPFNGIDGQVRAVL